MPIKIFGFDVVHWWLSRFMHKLQSIIELRWSWTFSQCSHTHVTYPTKTEHLSNVTCHVVAKCTHHLACIESLGLGCLNNQQNENNKFFMIDPMLVRKWLWTDIGSNNSSMKSCTALVATLRRGGNGGASLLKTPFHILIGQKTCSPKSNRSSSNSNMSSLNAFIMVIWNCGRSLAVQWTPGLALVFTLHVSRSTHHPSRADMMPEKPTPGYLQ